MTNIGPSVCRINNNSDISTGSLVQLEYDNPQEIIKVLLSSKFGFRGLDFKNVKPLDTKQITFEFLSGKTKFTADEFCGGNPKMLFVAQHEMDKKVDVVAFKWAPSFILPDELKFIEPKKAIAKGEEIVIYHYEETGDQKVAAGTVEEIRLTGKIKELSYTATTPSQGIGAPVVDKRGRMVGIHQREVVKEAKEDGKKEEKRGEGLGIELIMNEIGSVFKSMQNSLFKFPNELDIFYLTRT